MKPVLPIICIRYEILNPVFHLRNKRHSYGEQSILNTEEGSTLTTNMVHTESFLIYKVHIKRNVIHRYNDHCEIDNCYVCNR